MTVPNYMATFLRAVHQQQHRADRAGDERVKSAISVQRPQLAELNTLYTLSTQRPALFWDALTALEARCPDYVNVGAWQQAAADGRYFLSKWGAQAEVLGWTVNDLFGLHQPAGVPHLRYQRLSRYDCTGLIWLLRGLPVVALTDTGAAIQNPTGSIAVYRRHNNYAHAVHGSRPKAITAMITELNMDPT